MYSLFSQSCLSSPLFTPAEKLLSVLAKGWGPAGFCSSLEITANTKDIHFCDLMFGKEQQSASQGPLIAELKGFRL